jgi:large subunit ribosomal protein L25
MAEIVVAAEKRTETGKNVNRRLRTRGLIPGVLYGAKSETTPVSVSPKEIGTILRSATGENTLFELELGGSRRKVILKEFQVEPIKGRILHADFFEVALDKAIEVKVHVELTGVPVGVKVQGGILDFVTRELEVECLPTDIPEKIVVDVSELELGKHIRVGELKAPDKVKVLTDPGLVVAHVVTPRAEEEIAPAAAEAAPVEGEAPAEPEVIKKGKAEAGEAGEEKPERPERAERGEKGEKGEKKEKK